MTKTNWKRMLLCAGAGLLALPAFAAVETVTYGNFEVSFYGNGDVFSSNWWGNNQGSQDWTQEVKDCVGRALNYWSDVIVTDSTEKVKIAFLWQNLTSGALGGANPLYYWNPYSGVCYSNGEAALREHAYSGAYYNLANKETTSLVRISTNMDFYYGESETGIQHSQYDLQSVLVHEIGHLMGFDSFCSGDAMWGNVYLGNGDAFTSVTTFDTLLVSKNANGDLVNVFEAKDSVDHPGWVNYEQNVEFSTGKEYFLKTGETDSGELQLSTLKVYNPTTYSSGSSMSHVEATGTGEEPQMSYAIANGKIRRELTSEELTLLKAMGWTVAVPEPSAFGLLAGTFALAFAVSRRRRQ
ncbi:MAG: PEP-CTERM sorting domain-containing protein [Opitutales bacterium]|nr:PEP-CTERM sorting domain-containing protein [Opitutales bacterium]